MNFSWTEEQQDLYRTIVEFATRHLKREVVEADAEGRFDREGWNKIGEQGILASLMPEEYGGLGLGALESSRIMEALGYGCHDMGLVFSVAAHIYACTVPILRFGDERIKSAYLPKMGSGEWVATHSVTEPEAGSDPFSMKTRAEKDGGDYVLNGSKCYSSNAPCADVFLVHAVTHPGRGFMGITAFVVDKDTPGLTVSNPYKKIGLRTAPLGDVFFENCRVPEENRVGAEGNGGVIFTHSMNWERSCLFAAYLGMMQRQLEEAIQFAKERKQYGKPIKEFQAVSHRIVDMKVRLEASRLLAYRSSWMIDNEPPRIISPDSALTKLFVSEAAVASSLDAIQIHGGFGIMAEGGVERYIRDALPCRIFSGTSEMQKNTIAKGLGL